MDENTKEKKNDREYNKAVLDSMTQLVEEKLDGCKTGLPLVLTIVTALIAFLFAQNYSSKSVLWLAGIAMVLLLAAFMVLLFASFPWASYREFNKPLFKKQKMTTFEPKNIKSYWRLSDKVFSENLQEYLDADFTEKEQLQASLLKEKIDEYRLKSALLKRAYGILIAGAAVLIVVFYIGLFII